ncbi:DUF4224 domain-containing protein [Pseudomonas sp. S3_A03]
MAGHLESMFISSQDLAELTASARSAIQIRWLRTNGIPFILGGDGMPKVARQALLHKFGLAGPAAEIPLEPQARRVMYSMKRYEAFLERHWSPFLEPVNSPSKKPAHRKKPIQGKKETIYQLV